MKVSEIHQFSSNIWRLQIFIILAILYTYYMLTRKINHIQNKKTMKYILLWTQDDFSPFYYMGKGQQQFINDNCSMVNCYVTTDRNFFGGDVTKFDAIAFNGRNMQNFTKEDFPKERSLHQKYIYFNMESSDNEPICHDRFNNVFNWTASYKLKSDIPFKYILIRDKYGTVVGPEPNMKWVETKEEVNITVKNKLRDKNKAVAWFVSNCMTRSKREDFVHKLQSALRRYRLKIDVYGYCGNYECPRYKQYVCNLLLERYYYFYLSLENSFAEDYVTEKLLYATQHDIIPIVFGGANYSRFLPPKSYLSGLEYTPAELANVMAQLIASPILYVKFFNWKNYYSYEDAMPQNVCNLCESLNNRRMVETTSIYTDFKKWWNDDKYPEQCALQLK